MLLRQLRTACPSLEIKPAGRSQRRHRRVRKVGVIHFHSSSLCLCSSAETQDPCVAAAGLSAEEELSAARTRFQELMAAGGAEGFVQLDRDRYGGLGLFLTRDVEPNKVRPCKISSRAVDS